MLHNNTYLFNKVVGKGAYGIVYHSTHVPTGVVVAVKQLSLEQPLLFIRALREIKLLSALAGHDNVIKIHDLLPPASLGVEEVYIVEEYVSHNLSYAIYNVPLTQLHIKWITYQLLRGLKWIHSAGVVHRDLKPANVLINEMIDIKICDFGLARLVGADDDEPIQLTEYVTTRWYRAPEIMFSHPYTKSVDVWSVGCIMAEMYMYRPLFKGRDYYDQLFKVFSVLGTPSEEDLRLIASKRAQKFLSNVPRCPPKSLSNYLSHAPDRISRNVSEEIDKEAIEMMEQMLIINPSRRYSVEQCLKHHYLEEYHVESDEPTTTPIDPIEFSFDGPLPKLSLEKLRRELCYQILQFSAAP